MDTNFSPQWLCAAHQGTKSGIKQRRLRRTSQNSVASTLRRKYDCDVVTRRWRRGGWTGARATRRAQTPKYLGDARDQGGLGQRGGALHCGPVIPGAPGRRRDMDGAVKDAVEQRALLHPVSDATVEHAHSYRGSGSYDHVTSSRWRFRVYVMARLSAVLCFTLLPRTRGLKIPVESKNPEI